MKNKIFKKVPVEIPNKSGFDLSHENMFTAKVGELVPCLVNEMLPNDSVTLDVASQIQLPPMATDFYGKVDAKFEAFFVPNRIIYGGWQNFISYIGSAEDTTGYGLLGRAYMPGAELLDGSLIGPGSLADYLNLKATTAINSAYQIHSILPFLAYHKIWDDWYRDSNIQTSCFAEEAVPFGSVVPLNSRLPFINSLGLSLTNADFMLSEIANPATGHHKYENFIFSNGYNLFHTHQRNFAKDYFTNASFSPQHGGDSSVLMKVKTSTGSHVTITGGNPDTVGTQPQITGTDLMYTEFTIASLRAANSIQQFLERNNIAGSRYSDQINAQFGIYPSDAVTNRAIYLGSQTVPVYTKSVFASNEVTGSTSQNPFSSVGTKYGSPIGVGNGKLIDKFTASEHGFIMVIFSLVPRAYYSTGRHKMFDRQNLGDFANPLLAGVGDQEILSSEMLDYIPTNNPTFGYTQRYSEYKFMQDEVHGLLRDGQSLDAFCLQRSFTGIPILSSSFIEIPQNYLDGVSAVSSSVSTYGCWVDSYFNFKKSSTLPAYSLPTLGDMKNTHTEVIDSKGKRL